MARDTLVQIAAFEIPAVAHIALARLESAGIEAVLDGEHHVSMDWGISNAVGGVKLLVWAEDVQAAKRELDQPPPNQLEEAGEAPTDG